MSRSWTQESHSAWWATALMARWPGGASAMVDQSSSPSEAKRSVSAAVEATNRSSTSLDGISWVPATRSAGEDTGSKVARNRVGSPFSPDAMENAQKLLVLSRWTMTSRFVHPSHRLGCAHWSSVNPSSAAASRRRWRTVGSRIADGGPSSRMRGSAS